MGCTSSGVDDREQQRFGQLVAESLERGKEAARTSMRAYILSIGSELIHGALTDTNATFLAQELIAQGIELLHVTQVGDDRERLTRTLERAVNEADLVICTGGIGPTDDDLTREAIAALAGETPKVDPDLLETIRSYFGQRGLDMPERNAKQAWLIPCASIMTNPVGTAPGWFVRVGSTVIVAMPGVPREMFRMWKEQALPRLKTLLPDRAYHSANIRTLGIGESAAAELLGDLTLNTNPYVGTYAKDDGVHIRITAHADTESAAIQLLDGVLVDVRERLNGYIYTEDERSLSAVLLDHLRTTGHRIAIAEMGTGGRLTNLLLSEPDAGDVVVSGIVFPSAEATAESIADAARDEQGTSLALGLIIDVQPSTNGLFEGTMTAALTGEINAVESASVRAMYGEIQRRASIHAADLLRRALLKSDDGTTPTT